jgi:hypothetical protein
MGKFDRILRTLFGLALMLASEPFYDLIPSDFISYFCLVFGIINIISSIFGWCFMYSLLGSIKKEDDYES